MVEEFTDQEQKISEYVNDPTFEIGYRWSVPARLARKNRTLGCLYGLIEALSTQKGYCYASNQKLADMLGIKNPGQISEYLSQLKKDKWLDIELVGNHNSRRRIYLVHGFGSSHRLKPKHPSVKTEDLTLLRRKVSITDSSESVSETSSSVSTEPALDTPADTNKFEKSPIWKKNKEVMDRAKDELSKLEQKGKLNFPNEKGEYDWRYLVNHGKGFGPAKLFMMYYWQIKDLKFRNPAMAANRIRREMRDAELLAGEYMVSEFRDVLKEIKWKYDNQKNRGKEDIDWKLSTVIKEAQHVRPNT